MAMVFLALGLSPGAAAEPAPDGSSAASLAAAREPQRPQSLPRWIIPAGREAQLQALIRPLALGAPAAAGKNLEKLQVDLDRIDLHFGPPGGPADVKLELRHPAAAAAGDLTAGLVRVRVPPGVPQAIVDVVVAALSARRESELPWVRLPSAAAAQSSMEPVSSWPLWGLAGVVALGVAVALAALMLSRRRRAGRSSL